MSLLCIYKLREFSYYIRLQHTGASTLLTLGCVLCNDVPCSWVACGLGNSSRRLWLFVICRVYEQYCTSLNTQVIRRRPDALFPACLAYPVVCMTNCTGSVFLSESAVQADCLPAPASNQSNEVLVHYCIPVSDVTL